MLFSIQTYIEEYLIKRGIQDSDGYAIKLSNLFFYQYEELDELIFLKKVTNIRTVLFKNNNISNRSEFEQQIIIRLKNEFKKKGVTLKTEFPGGVEEEKQKLQHSPKLTIGLVLNEFIHAIEARSIDVFWRARKKDQLIEQPEKIAQSLFAMFVAGTLINRPGLLLREFQSGIGYVDMGIVFSSTLHLVEVKICKDKIIGPNQLEQYMKSENRHEGSLLILDARKPENKISIPMCIRSQAGIINIFSADINPIAPSRMN